MLTSKVHPQQVPVVVINDFTVLFTIWTCHGCNIRIVNTISSLQNV